jgi:hypothetical protein
LSRQNIDILLRQKFFSGENFFGRQKFFHATPKFSKKSGAPIYLA